MRRLLVALFAVGLVVAPTFGATIDAKIQVTKAGVPVTALNLGDTAAVEGWFKVNSTTEALCAIGGSVTATAGSNLTVGTIPTDFSFYVANFQGFQPLLGEPGTDINPAQPVAGANGAVSSIGTAQGFANQISPSWVKTDALGRNNTWVKVFSYNVTAAAAGTVTLDWQEAVAGGNGGWYTTDTGMVNGVNTPTTSTTITVNGSSPATCTASSVNNAVAGKKTLWRTKKSLVRLTFDRALTAAPTAGQIKIQEILAGGTYGPDLSSNFTFTLESGNTVVKVLDNSTAGVLSNRKWYCIRTDAGSCPGVVDFKWLTPVLVGDYDGNAVVTNALDIGPMAAKLASPSFGTVDDDRRDVDGNKVMTNALDLGPARQSLLTPTLPTKPTGH